jgi:hypothetical protein
VTNSGTTAYRFNGGPVNNPTQELTRGNTYVFNVSATGHPFYIKTALVTGTGSQWTLGVTGQGATNSACTFVVPASAPATLFYHCSVHSGMGGTLNIKDPAGVPGSEIPRTVWLGPAVPNPTNNETSISFTLPRNAWIDFSVFDTRGRAIRVLSRGITPTGPHFARWDGRDREGRLAPSGVYYYRLKVEDQVLSGRLVLTH